MLVSFTILIPLVHAETIKAQVKNDPLCAASRAWLASDYDTAYRIFNSLAHEGNDRAQDRLASLYYYGQGVDRNYQDAYVWYEKAANNDVLSAQYMLAHLYFYGKGTEKNYDAARKWLLKVAKTHFPTSPHLNSKSDSLEKLSERINRMSYNNQRYAEQYWVWLAQRDLARLYQNGFGVEKNPIEAYAWYDLVSSYGDGQATRTKEKISKHLDKQQIKAAEQLAQAYRVHYGINFSIR